MQAAEDSAARTARRGRREHDIYTRTYSAKYLLKVEIQFPGSHSNTHIPTYTPLWYLATYIYLEINVWRKQVV